MTLTRWWPLGALMVAAVLATAASAAAEDTLKLAIGQRGNWDTAIPELGQRAGIFKKHGLVLDLLYTQGGGETQQAVLSGSVDIGVAAGTLGVLGAFAKETPRNSRITFRWPSVWGILDEAERGLYWADDR